MIFCNINRIVPIAGSQNFQDMSMRETRYLSLEMADESPRKRCYNVEYDVAEPDGKAMAFTTNSDFANKGAWHNAPSQNR